MCYYLIEDMDGSDYVLAGPYATYPEALHWLIPTIAKIEEERQFGDVTIKAYPDGTDFHTHFCPTHICSGDCNKESETCSWKDRRDRGLGCGDAPVVPEPAQTIDLDMLYRTGWLGVWDALKAAIRGDRPQVPDRGWKKTEWNKGSNWDWRGSPEDI